MYIRLIVIGVFFTLSYVERILSHYPFQTPTSASAKKLPLLKRLNSREAMRELMNKIKKTLTPSAAIKEDPDKESEKVPAENSDEVE